MSNRCKFGIVFKMMPLRLMCSLFRPRFHALPKFVKVVLTARMQLGEEVQTAKFFGGWDPKCIQRDRDENMEDMKMLLRLRLESSNLLHEGELKAVDVLARKSKVRLLVGPTLSLEAVKTARLTLQPCDMMQGEFIYAKYALFCMRLLKPKPDRWTAAELEAEMPEGLDGAYQLVMRGLTSALRMDKPELLELLTDKVLPVLVASREPLSCELVAWACVGCNADAPGTVVIGKQVQELLEKGLDNLFPLRTGPGGGKVAQPYHKSVLDWFKCEDGRDAGVFRVEPTRGHELLGLVGEAYLSRHAVLASAVVAEVVAEVVAVEDRYATRHTVAHLSLARGGSKLAIARGASGHASPSTSEDALKRLLLSVGFWEVSLSFRVLFVGSCFHLV